MFGTPTIYLSDDSWTPCDFPEADFWGSQRNFHLSGNGVYQACGFPLKERRAGGIRPRAGQGVIFTCRILFIHDFRNTEEP